MITLNFWSQRRVLITGHTGFKGSWLSTWLLSMGAHVCGYSLDEEPTSPSLFTDLNLKENQNKFDGNFFHHIGNICNYESISNVVASFQPEVIFHLAAQPLVIQGYKNPLETWETNVLGTLKLLEASKSLSNICAVIIVTTDKVYRNQEWCYGYRETDPLGGCDPYSASKASCELAIESWRASFTGDQPHQTQSLRIASARAGNVIGGGDWSLNRIIPDVMRAFSNSEVVSIRSPLATRPWQHVLEPLSGYLCLAERLITCEEKEIKTLLSPFNFGPHTDSNRSVQALVEECISFWPNKYCIENNTSQFYESTYLHVSHEKSYNCLNWKPVWDFSSTVQRTVSWYKSYFNGCSPLQCCIEDISAFMV